MKTSPTSRSLAYLREQGYMAEVVEKRVPNTNITKDLFGFIDILAIKHGEILGVQTTTNENAAARIRKIAEHPNTSWVREAGIRIHVHGWRKLKSGWAVRVEDVS